MAQTIYTSARNVDVRECEPLPLLRHNYLNEFRTELEKAKARESLGIFPLDWGNIKGFISQLEDLVNYIKDNFNYSVENYENIKSVLEALDYLFEIVSDYATHKEEFSVTQEDLEKCKLDISDLQETLGVYVEKVNSLQSSTTNMDMLVNLLLEITLKHNESILKIEESFDGNILYTTDLDDSLTIESDFGGFKKGTKVSDLEGKSISALFDQLLFPTTVRDLVKPTLIYSPSTQLIEVNTSGVKPSLKFTKNDAGPEINRTLTITFENNNYDSISIYSLVGQYKYTGSVTYSDGSKLINNKGEETNLYIKGGTLTANAVVNVTYPWYAGNTEKIEKQKLVLIGKNSGDIEVELSGRAVIKIPKVAKLEHVTFDAGLGFLEVDWQGWESSEEVIGGYSYNVWTKIDSYSKSFKHKINFTL